MKKLLCMILCLFILIPSLASCSKPPEYSEIEARFRELVEASQEVNQLIFGEGLETYERVYDPMSSLKVHTATDPENPEKQTNTYYYEISDPTLGRVVAFRSSYLDPYSYVQVLDQPDESRTVYYRNDLSDVYCYLLEDYTEPEYEFFYKDDDPTDYDYVRMDSKYLSVEEIKAAAEAVYSSEYLESIYEWLFVGTAAVTEGVEALSARYIEYTDSEGSVYFMQSNTFDPLIFEHRIYDYTTAEMVRPSNKKYVNIEIDSYLESKPEEILRVRISLILVDGVWMLDSATY